MGHTRTSYFPALSCSLSGSAALGWSRRHHVLTPDLGQGSSAPSTWAMTDGVLPFSSLSVLIWKMGVTSLHFRGSEAMRWINASAKECDKSHHQRCC